MTYTIKQVSEMISLPVSTIRYYDKMGLIPFLEKNESGYRLIGCLVSFPATHILVSQFGMNGTSYSISVSYIVVSIILLFRLVRLVKPKAID